MSSTTKRLLYPRCIKERYPHPHSQTTKSTAEVTTPLIMNATHLKSSIKKIHRISSIPNKVVGSSFENHKKKQRFRSVQYDVDKYSKYNFNKFKKIVYHKNMTHDLRLKICHLIVSNSFNCDMLYKMIESPKFDGFDDLINISDISLELSQRYIYKVQEKSYKKCWLVQFSGAVSGTPTNHCFSRLLQYMDSHDIKFKSIIVSDKLDGEEQPEHIYDPRYDYSDFAIQKAACATHALTYCITTKRVASNWLSTLVTSLQIQTDTDISNIETFPNLNEVVLVAPELLNSKTIEKLFQILTYRSDLNALKIKFKALSYDNAPLNALTDLHYFFKTHIELYLDSSANDKKSYTLSAINIDSISQSLGSAEYLFRSIDLPLELTLLNQLTKFKHLSKLTVNVMPTYDGFWMQLQSSTIKVLNIIGPESKQQQIVKLDIHHLSNLRSFNCFSCRIDSTTFESVPRTLDSINLTSTEVHNAMVIPVHLRYFRLFNSFPMIDCFTYKDAFPRLKVDLTWYTSNTTECEIVNFINSFGYFVDEVTLKSIGYFPNYITLVSSFDNPFSDTLEFGVIFSEDVPEYGNLLTSLEFKVINTAEDVSELLSDLALACIKSFQRQKTESVRGVIVKSAPVERFEDVLVEALKEQFAGSACSLDTLDIKKMSFP